MSLRFSIIVPTKNRLKSLSRTLKALQKVVYPKSAFEVIVVDNEPEDQKAELLVRKLKQRFPQVRYVKNLKPGISSSRNVGASLARYSHLIFLDDDVIVQPSFLEGFEAAWVKYPRARVLGGKILARLESERLKPAQKRMLQEHDWCFAHQDRGEEDKVLGLGELLFSACISYRRKSAKEKIFNEELGVPYFGKQRVGGEDYELCTRKILEKEQLLYVADERTRVTHLVDSARFSDTCLSQRYFMSGVELGLYELLVKKSFPDFRSIYLEDLITFKGGRSLITNRFARITLLSYLFHRRFLRDQSQKNITE